MATPPPAEPTRTSLPIPTLSALVIATAMSICAIMFPQDFMAIITRINKQFMEMVAEGVETSKAVRKLGQRHKVAMPISAEVYNIIYRRKKPSRAVADLMQRKTKSE